MRRPFHGCVPYIYRDGKRGPSKKMINSTTTAQRIQRILEDVESLQSPEFEKSLYDLLMKNKIKIRRETQSSVDVDMTAIPLPVLHVMEIMLKEERKKRRTPFEERETDVDDDPKAMEVKKQSDVLKTILARSKVKRRQTAPRGVDENVVDETEEDVGGGGGENEDDVDVAQDDEQEWADDNDDVTMDETSAVENDTEFVTTKNEDDMDVDDTDEDDDGKKTEYELTMTEERRGGNSRDEFPSVQEKFLYYKSLLLCKEGSLKKNNNIV